MQCNLCASAMTKANHASYVVIEGASDTKTDGTYRECDEKVYKNGKGMKICHQEGQWKLVRENENDQKDCSDVLYLKSAGGSESVVPDGQWDSSNPSSGGSCVVQVYERPCSLVLPFDTGLIRFTMTAQGETEDTKSG